MSERLEVALQAHGGLERWREVQSLDVRVSVTGGLYRLKGHPEGVPNVNMKIDARRPAVTITPLRLSAVRKGSWSPAAMGDHAADFVSALGLSQVDVFGFSIAHRLPGLRPRIAIPVPRPVRITCTHDSGRVIEIGKWDEAPGRRGLPLSADEGRAIESLAGYGGGTRG